MGIRQFQLGRLLRALEQREQAGNTFSERLVDRAIVSLVQACQRCGIRSLAACALAQHRARTQL